jgi:hypothetical protein
MDNKENKKIRERLFRDRPLSGISLNEFERPTNDYNTNLRDFDFIRAYKLWRKQNSDSILADILLKARKKRPDGLDSYEIIKELYKRKVKIVYANILRDLRKLIAVGLVEKRNSFYRIKENMKLNEIISSFIKPYIIDRMLSKIEEYAKSIDKTD